ncbi:MAG: amidohydrolase family protein [Proteobacteria bacterium]|nr:amidohydrolase family protein [Pseudomonadota bacterium]
MKTRVLKFQAAYVQHRWLSPCYVSLNREGQLLEISEHEPLHPIDESISGYLLPGFANAHSHSFQYLMCGMAEHLEPGHEADNFWSWRERMYQLAGLMSPDLLLDLTSHFYRILLEHGYTSVCEFHYIHHDPNGKTYQQPAAMSEAIMEAARRSGIRLTLVPVYYQQSAPGVPIQPRQRRFYSKDTDSYLNLLENIAQLNKNHFPEVILGYGVHSMRAATPRDIKTILGTHWSLGPAHVHVSEQSNDAVMFEQTYHCRAVDWLYDNIPLSDHHNLIHATHINDLEIKKIVASKATVVLCPSTEANLGDGIFPLPEYFNQGGSFSIGTDSHVELCPFGEARMPEYIHRLFLEKRNSLCDAEHLDAGQLLFDHIQKAGRKSLGLTGDSFSIGKPFEGIVLDSDHDRLLEKPLKNIMGIAMYCGDKSLIDRVYVDGHALVNKGQHRDRVSGLNAYRQVLKSVMRSLNH